MSDSDNHEVCPKCGYNSANTEVCEACGVIFERVRGRRQLAPDDSSVANEADMHESFYRPAYSGVETPAAGVGRVLPVAIVVAVVAGIVGWYIYQHWATSPSGLIKQHRALIARAIDIIQSPDSDDVKSRGLAECLDRTARLKDRIVKLDRPKSVEKAQQVAGLLVANEVMRQELEAADDALGSNTQPNPSSTPMATASAVLDLAEQPRSKSAIERVNAILKPVAPGAARTMTRSQKLFDQRASDVREAEEFSATPQDREQAVKDFDHRFGKGEDPPVPAVNTPGPRSDGSPARDKALIETARHDARRFIENVRKNPFADVTTSTPIDPYR